MSKIERRKLPSKATIMRVVILALVAFLFSAQGVLAFPGCDVVAAALETKIGAKITGKSPLMGNIFMTHPAASDLVVFCGTGLISVAIAKNGTPNGDYLRLATVAARIVTDSDDLGLPSAIALCLKKARKSKDELSEGSTEHVSIECQSFVRDGGGNHITVSPNRHNE